MNRDERYWIAGYAGLLVLLTAIPYVLGVQSANEGWVFSGHLIGVEDGHSYIAKMLRGSVGDWIFRTPYTVSEQAGVAVFIPYLLLGKLLGASADHEQFIVLFHLLRSVGIVVAVLGTYRFAARFLTGKSDRRWVTVLATVGGGLGWLLLLVSGGEMWQELPLLFISPESFGFLATLSVPHLVLARGLLLLSLVLYLEALAGERPAAGAAVLTLLTSLVHPLSGAIAVAVIALHQLSLLGAASRKRAWRAWSGKVRSAAAAVVLALPYLGYLAARSFVDPYLQGWAAQNRILSPHIGYYALAWGLLLPLAWLGARRALREGASDHLLLIAWALALPALAYAPVSVQRRLVEGGWVVLATLAALGLQRVRPLPWRSRIRSTVLALALPGSLILLLGAARLAREPAEPAFLPAQKVAAFQWLDEHARVDEVVLADVATGNQLPAWAPVRVPVGHGPESVPFESTRERVRTYYSSGSDAQRSRLLRELGVDFVIVGTAERSLAGGSFLPSDVLSGVQVSGPYAIYRVNLGDQ